MTLSEKVTNEIKKAARDNVTLFSTRDRMYKRYKEIYFMDNMETPKNSTVDKGDWKLTPSPSGRNEVTGIHRLLNTSDLHVNVEGGGSDNDKIEKALQTILKVSNEGRRGRVLSDAALSSVLYGSVVLFPESVDDLLKVKGLSKPKQLFLQKKRERTPFTIRIISSEQSYPMWDEDMLIQHTWRYKVRGASLKSRWGLTGSVKENQEYEVWEIFTPENKLVFSPQYNETIYSGPHNLSCLPVFVAYAGGSDLFFKPEEQLQSFLYAKAKGELDKRENSILTTIFTNIHMRGLLGPLLAIDPNKDGVPDEIVVQQGGGFRYIVASAKQIDDKVIDPTIFAVKNLLDELSGQSTIQKQTIGDNIGAGAMPFSSMAMLSNAGKLPLVDPQRALEQAFTDCYNHILYRIREENIPNKLIEPTSITPDTQIEVSLDAKLPQDSLRNAQIATSLGDTVSEEWKHSNLLQISDSTKMQDQVMKEQMKKAILQAMLSNPQIMQQAVSAIMGGGQPTPPAQPGADPNAPQQPPPGQSDAQAQGQPTMEQLQQALASGQLSPEQTQQVQQMMAAQGQGQQPTPEQMQMMQQQQGQPQDMGAQGMPNVEGMPMTDSMTPAAESPTGKRQMKPAMKGR